MHKWLIALLFLLPAASAQVPSAAFDFTLEGPTFLTPDGDTAYNATITVGCIEVLENMGEADVSIALAEPPEGISAAPVEVHFGIEDCVGEEAITQTVAFPVTASSAAGLVPFTLTASATLGTHVVQAEVPDVMVDYQPGHVMTPDGDQTFQVTGDMYEFDLVIEITANAKTMVMFEDKQVSGTASLSGLKANIFDVAAGDRNLTNRILFTAPDGPWTEETVSFYTYSHCLDGPDCGENFARTVTWTFQNADPQPAQDAPVDNEAPGVGLVAGAGLLGAAMVARRKDKQIG